MPCGRRRRQPVGREGEVRLRADAREDAARHRAGGRWRRRSWFGAAQDQSDRAPVGGGGPRRGMEATGAPQRHDARVFQAVGRSLGAGGCAALPGHHRFGSEAGRCRRRVFPRARAAPRVDDPHVDLPEHLSGRLPRQRDPLRSTRDARRAHASGRRSRAAARGSAQDRQRSRDRGGLGPARRPAVLEQRRARLGSVHGDRGRDQETLRHRHAAGDEHRGDRHGLPACEGHPVLRGRARHRHRGRAEGLRRAQRPGANPRKRAVPVREVLLRRGAHARAGVSSGQLPLKSQAPRHSQRPEFQTNLQNSSKLSLGLGGWFGIWRLGVLWSLVLGSWDLSTRT